MEPGGFRRYAERRIDRRQLQMLWEGFVAIIRNIAQWKRWLTDNARRRVFGADSCHANTGQCAWHQICLGCRDFHMEPADVARTRDLSPQNYATPAVSC